MFGASIIGWAGCIVCCCDEGKGDWSLLIIVNLELELLVKMALNLSYYCLQEIGHYVRGIQLYYHQNHNYYLENIGHHFQIRNISSSDRDKESPWLEMSLSESDSSGSLCVSLILLERPKKYLSISKPI